MNASYDYEDGLRDHCVDDPLWAADEIERLRAEVKVLHDVLPLPPGHHHVTVGEDGTWHAVPTERVGWCWPHERWPVMRMMLPDDGAPPPPRVGLRAMFADAPVQGDDR